MPQETLEERGIQLAVHSGSPDEVALRSDENASMIVCDMSYLRLQKGWRERLAKEARCLVVQVETEVVVPVELASNKREHAARTLRPRMREHLDDFLVELEPTALDKRSLDIETSGLDLSDIGAILDGMELDRTVPPVSHLYKGGTSEAKRILEQFIEKGLDAYSGAPQPAPERRRLAHEQVPALRSRLAGLRGADDTESGGPAEDIDSYLEEVIVRRELSMNFCHYTPDYDSYSCLPEWAKKTLEEHATTSANTSTPASSSRTPRPTTSIGTRR